MGVAPQEELAQGDRTVTSSSTDTAAAQQKGYVAHMEKETELPG